VSEQADGGNFDVRELNHALNKAKLRDNVASAATVVFCLVIVILLLAFDLGRALHGQLPTFGVFVLFVTVVWLVGITGVLVWGIRRKRPGAVSVQVDGQGMTLEVPERASVQVQWSDPGLRVELHDLSRVNPRMLSVPTPYFLKVKGVHSAITKQAYEAILGQATYHGLDDQVRHANRWLSPANAMVHVIGSRQTS
jgi:hypothetical protein